MARWVALLIIVIGGYYHVRDIDFAAKMPTSWLLKLDRHDANWATRELWSARFCNGKLSATDAGQFLEQQVVISPVEATNPHPASESVCLRISVGNVGAFQHTQWDPLVTDWNILIDGRSTPYKVESHRTPVDFRTEHFCVQVGPIAVGLREVVLSGTCTLTTVDRSGWRVCGENRPSPMFTFTRSVNLLIEQGPVSDFARPIWTEKLAGQVTSLVRARALGVSGEHVSMLSVTCDSLPVSLAGDVSVRPTGFDEYQRVQSRLVFPSGSPNVLVFWRTELGGVDGVQSLDVIFVPNAKLALDSGLTGYFAGVVEWTAVPISPSDQADREGAPSIDARAPSRVEQHTVDPGS